MAKIKKSFESNEFETEEINSDKKTIYMPVSLYNCLVNDAKMFRILKKDSSTINLNHFQNLLIQNYYNEYTEVLDRQYEKIKGILYSKVYNEDDLKELSRDILYNVVLPKVSNPKGVSTKHVPFRPDKATIKLLRKMIENDRHQKLSPMLCLMYLSYSQKPSYQREQIILAENYKELMECCDKTELISLTFNKPNFRPPIQVLPYTICPGKNELCNYLIGQMRNTETGVFEPFSFRLTYIEHISVIYSKYVKPSQLRFKEDVEKRLKEMITTDPAFAIVQDEEVCLRLDANGVKSYEEIYTHRPDVIRKETDGEYMKYYFKCSEFQAFNFAKRFEHGEVEVIFPQALRDRIIRFYKDGLKTHHTEP